MAPPLYEAQMFPLQVRTLQDKADIGWSSFAAEALPPMAEQRMPIMLAVITMAGHLPVTGLLPPVMALVRRPVTERAADIPLLRALEVLHEVVMVILAVGTVRDLPVAEAKDDPPVAAVVVEDANEVCLNSDFHD
jgi:hypothetical protein